MPALSRKVTWVVSILWALSWHSQAAAAESRKITLGILQTGAQDFVHTVMEQQKVLQKYNLPYERVGSLSPPALHLMIAEKTVDIGYGGLTTMARARAEGKSMLVIFGIYIVQGFLYSRPVPPEEITPLLGKSFREDRHSRAG